MRAKTKRAIVGVFGVGLLIIGGIIRVSDWESHTNLILGFVCILIAFYLLIIGLPLFFKYQDAKAGLLKIPKSMLLPSCALFVSSIVIMIILAWIFDFYLSTDILIIIPFLMSLPLFAIFIWLSYHKYAEFKDKMVRQGNANILNSTYQSRYKTEILRIYTNGIYYGPDVPYEYIFDAGDFISYDCVKAVSIENSLGGTNLKILLKNDFERELEIVEQKDLEVIQKELSRFVPKVEIMNRPKGLQKFWGHKKSSK